jgi:hypothetical protein
MVELRENLFSCARFCVEVGLEKGITEVVMISLYNWNHLRQLDYEKLPFKCNSSHKYGHSAKDYKKSRSQQNLDTGNEEQWKLVLKKARYVINLGVRYQSLIGNGPSIVASRNSEGNVFDKGSSSNYQGTSVPV